MNHLIDILTNVGLTVIGDVNISPQFFHRGYCDAFALSLHEDLGYPLFLVQGLYWDDDWEEWASEPCHIVVQRTNDVFVDVDGEKTAKELKDNCLFQNDVEKVEIVSISPEEACFTFTMEGVGEFEKDLARLWRAHGVPFKVYEVHPQNDLNSKLDALEHPNFAFFALGDDYVFVQKKNPMRRNPRPIPLDIEYFEDLTEEMLLGYYNRLVQYKGLPIYRSTLMNLMKTLPKRFKPKLCRDEDLEFCVDYTTKRFNQTVPILGMAGYPRFEVEGMTDVRGVQLPLTDVSTRVMGQDPRLAPTDMPFIAAAATPNQDGLTAYVFVALNGGMSPKDFVDLYEQDYDFLFHLLYQILVHEFTHARDVISLDFLGFMGGLSHKEDRNTKVELRSRLREIIEDVRKHIRDNGFGWLKKNLQKRPMDQVIKQISLPYLMDYDVYTDDSHVYLMGGVYQWLQENGYTIPRRRF